MRYVTTSKGVAIEDAKRIIRGNALFVRRGCKSIAAVAHHAASEGFDAVTVVRMQKGKTISSKLKITQNGRGFIWASGP